jgi:hypothetical protein
MKIIFVLLLSVFSLGLSAQIEFRTGDVELDSDLNVINSNAKTDLPAFKADLTADFGVSAKNVDYMLSINMEPAEIYFALEVSVAVNKPIETVIDTYETHRDKGWGYIAQQLGIKPGSPEFHVLKGKSKTKKDKAAKTNNGNGQVKKTPVQSTRTVPVSKKG